MIRRCDSRRPYVFISYSSRDREVVTRDVEAFQARGLNVWFDEKNLDCSLDAWTDSALQAICSQNCSLIVFYLSPESAASRNCHRELIQASSADTRDTHKGRTVPFIIVETKRAGDLGDYCRECRESFLAGGQEEKALAVEDFYARILHGKREKSRIHPREDSESAEEYYDRICSYFPDFTMHARNRLRYLVPFYLEGSFEEGLACLDRDPDWVRLPDAAYGAAGRGRQERDIWDFLLRAFSADGDFRGRRLGAMWQRRTEGNPLLQLAWFSNGDRDAFREVLILEAGLVLFESGVGILWYEAAFGRACRRGDLISEVPGLKGKRTQDPMSLTQVMEFQNVFKELARYPGRGALRICMMRTGNLLAKNAGKKQDLPAAAAACREDLTFEAFYSEEGRRMLNRTRFYDFSMGRWVCSLLQALDGKAPVRFFTERAYPLRKMEEQAGKRTVFQRPVPDKAILFQYIVTGRIEETGIRTAAAYLTYGYNSKYRLEPEKIDCLTPFENACWFAAPEGCGYYVRPEARNEDFYDNQMFGTVIGDYFLIDLLVCYQVYTMRRFLIRYYEADPADREERIRLAGEIRSFLLLNSFTSVSCIHSHDEFYAYLGRRLGKDGQMEKIRDMYALLTNDAL